MSFELFKSSTSPRPRRRKNTLAQTSEDTEEQTPNRATSRRSSAIGVTSEQQQITPSLTAALRFSLPQSRTPNRTRTPHDLELKKARLYLTETVNRIREQLKAASETDGSDRHHILQELLEQICEPLSKRVDDLFADKLATYTSPRLIRYYQLAAFQFARAENSVEGMEEIVFALWSNDYFPLIFAACFYVWMFKFRGAQLNRNFNMMLKGVNRLFWSDLEHDTQHFLPIYIFLKYSVLLKPLRHSLRTRAFTQYFLDLFALVAKFHFYYEKEINPRHFISEMARSGRHSAAADVDRSQVPLSDDAELNTLESEEELDENDADDVDGNDEEGETVAAAQGDERGDEAAAPHDGGEKASAGNSASSMSRSTSESDVRPGGTAKSHSPPRRLPSPRAPHMPDMDAAHALSASTKAAVAVLASGPFTPGEPDFLDSPAMPDARLGRLDHIDAYTSLDSLYDDFDAKYSEEQVSVMKSWPILSNLFVESVSRQMESIRNETVLISYLEHCAFFKNWRITTTTSLRLQAVIYNYTSPGAPLYAPRSVRRAATNVQSILFATGRWFRFMVYYTFRLMHPVEAARSIVYWTKFWILLYWGRLYMLVLRTLGVGKRAAARVVPNSAARWYRGGRRRRFRADDESTSSYTTSEDEDGDGEDFDDLSGEESVSESLLRRLDESRRRGKSIAVRKSLFT